MCVGVWGGGGGGGADSVKITAKELPRDGTFWMYSNKEGREKYTKPHPYIFPTLKCDISVKRCKGG